MADHLPIYFSYAGAGTVAGHWGGDNYSQVCVMNIILLRDVGKNHRWDSDPDTVEVHVLGDTPSPVHVLVRDPNVWA
jgi:hypothetical protein